MTREDFALATRWFGLPHVREWWGDHETDLDAVVAKYGPRIDGSEPTEMFIICSYGDPVGMIQRYRIVDYPEWAQALSVATDVTAAAGIDYLVGEPDAVGQGVGTEAIRAFVPSIYDRWSVTSIVVSVQQENRASWRALESAGFTRVWAGALDSEDPSDAGPAFVYRHSRRV